MNHLVSPGLPHVSYPFRSHDFRAKLHKVKVPSVQLRPRYLSDDHYHRSRQEEQEKKSNPRVGVGRVCARFWAWLFDWLKQMWDLFRWFELNSRSAVVLPRGDSCFSAENGDSA